MSFTRIQNEARLVSERALDRYVALLQQEKEWTADEETEMKNVCKTLGREMATMTADRQVIAQARRLQDKIDAGTGSREPRAAAQRAVEAYDNETRELTASRRAGYFQLTHAASKLEQMWLDARHAQNELVKLMQQHPMLLGDVSAVAEHA